MDLNPLTEWSYYLRFPFLRSVMHFRSFLLYLVPEPQQTFFIKGDRHVGIVAVDMELNAENFYSIFNEKTC